MLIDKISYRNPLKDINPGIKFILVMITLVFLLSSQNILLFLFNILLYNMLLLFLVKVKLFELMELYLIPAFFILMSAFSILLIKGDINLFLMRSFSSISVVYFLICTTPMIDLDYIFYKLKFPKIFREIFLLTYRYLFLLSENKENLLLSQKVRLGYKNYKNSKKSLPLLIVSILKKTYYYKVNSINSLEVRLGKEFIFKHKNYKKIGKEVYFIIFIIIINTYLTRMI